MQTYEEARAADDRFLQRYGEPPTSLHLRVGGRALHLLQWGDPAGQPLLMVHGMRGHARWFSPVGPVVGERYRALSLDLSGHGRSDPSPEGGQLAYAQDVVAAIEALDLRDLVLLGHSMGGSVVLRAIAQVEERVRALVIVDAGFGPPPNAQAARARSPSLPRPRRRYDSFASARERFVLRPGDNCAEAALLDHLALHAIERTRDGAYTWRFEDPAYMREGAPPPRPPPPDSSLVSCPVLAIYGALSPIRQRVDLEDYAQRFPNAPDVQVDVLDGAYHHVFLDQPQAFNALLLRRLGGG